MRPAAFWTGSDGLMTLVFIIILRIAKTLEPHRQCGDGSLGRAPHSTHCGKFLLCSNGDPWMVMDCPGGTLFNVYTMQCDHADLVDCGTRNATDSTHAGAHTTEVPTSRTWGAVSNHVLWTDAKSYRGSFKRYPVDEHYEDYGIRGRAFRDDFESKVDRVRTFLRNSLQRLRGQAGSHLNNLTYEANRYRGHMRPFRMVQSLLGNSVHGIDLSKSAFQQLLCLREIKKKIGLTRHEMYRLMRRLRRLPDLVWPNPLRVVPDDDRPIPGMKTCPFPGAKQSACRRDAPYRTFDGSCNNLQHPLWGRAMRAFRRVIEPDYADGIGEPRVARDGRPLPSARLVSATLFRDADRPSSAITLMHMTFGQFLDHDVGRTAVSKLVNARGEMVEVECGESGCEAHTNAACRPITLPPGDEAYEVRPCLMFVRSQEVLRDDCRLGPREQLNQVTPYLDASMVYGHSINESEKFRIPFNKWRGRLVTTPNSDRYKRPLLPKTKHKECRDTTPRIQCFGAGDSRVNEQVGLMSLHTIFHRYHNYLEERLHHLNPQWDGELLFQETRRILNAVWQHIVYNEYLPPTMGDKQMRRNGLKLQRKGYFNGYDPKVNVDTLNSFQTAAFRFGHSQVTNLIYFSNQRYTTRKKLFFSEVFNRPYEVYNNGNPGGSGVDSILLGQVSQRAETSDHFFARQVTKHLFSEGPPHRPGTDLPALNIQRGRDHGLPGYVRWRAWCGLTVPKTFDDLIHVMHELDIHRLKALYRNVHDIDLFAGGMAESVLKGSMLGPTFACLIGLQFRNFRLGDRFWYERQDKDVGFTSYQLSEIRKMTLSRVMCNTMDHVETIQKFVMLQPFRKALKSYGAGDGYLLQTFYRGEKNERRPCPALPDLDMRAWKDRKQGPLPTRKHRGNKRYHRKPHNFKFHKFNSLDFDYIPQYDKDIGF